MLTKHVMNSRLSFFGCATTCMLLASSPIYRRQQFLIRSLCGGIDHHINQSRNMRDLKSVEVDAESIIRSITPALDLSRHKGQAGKIAVIGGYREYTGAPDFAAISALKIRLIEKVLSSEVNDVDATKQVPSLAKKIRGVTILRKGKSDLISDGDTVKSVSIYGSPRRCGGQGDILSGSVAVFLSWARRHIKAADQNSNLSCKNPAVLECIAGSALMRKAASLAFSNKQSLEDICPAT